MSRFKRVGAATIFAVCIAIASAGAAPAAAATPYTTSVEEVSISDACAKLAALIDYLEGLPAGRLRDFLLTAAHRLFDAYCTAP